MNSGYCFTAVEDQLLLALRDQGHYNWDLIEQVTGRGEWALKHRYDMLHKGLRRMDPRGKGKMGVHTVRKLKMSKVPHGWTPRKDEDLQILHFEGHAWLEISYKLPPYNGPECLARWLSLKPEAKYPYKTEMDFRWTFEEVKKFVSMKKEGRSWEEMAKGIPWNGAECRKYWCSHHWFAFIYWFPDGRNFRDQPWFWQHKVPAQQYKYSPQGQNIKNTAEPRDKDRKGGKETEREGESGKKTDEGQVKHKADLNGNESLGDTAEPKDEDAERGMDNEDVKEISEERYGEEIARSADNGGKEKKHKDNATRRKGKTASKKAKPSKQDAKREEEMLEDDEASWMLEQAEDEKYGLIHPRHASERQSFRFT